MLHDSALYNFMIDIAIERQVTVEQRAEVEFGTGHIAWR